MIVITVKYDSEICESQIEVPLIAINNVIINDIIFQDVKIEAYECSYQIE